jgi:hypothetical protein
LNVPPAPGCAVPGVTGVPVGTWALIEKLIGAGPGPVVQALNGGWDNSCWPPPTAMSLPPDELLLGSAAVGWLRPQESAGSPAGLSAIALTASLSCVSPAVSSVRCRRCS